MKIRKIVLPAPEHPFPDVNTYLIEDIPLLVDTGMGEKAFEVLKSEVENLGFELNSLKVFSTHLHPDHIGLASFFHNGVYVSPGDRPLCALFDRTKLVEVMRGWVKKFGIPEEFEPFLKGTPWNFAPPRINFSYPEIEGIHMVSTPGHSPGHTSFLVDNHLIGGDAVLEYTTPNVSFTPFSSDDPLGDYMNTLKKIEMLKLKTLLPAHGKIIRGHRRVIRQIRRHHNQRLEEIFHILEGRELSVVEIAEEISWETCAFSELDVLNKKLAIGETLAHLRYLERRGLVESEGIPVKFRLSGNK